MSDSDHNSTTPRYDPLTPTATTLPQNWVTRLRSDPNRWVDEALRLFGPTLVLADTEKPLEPRVIISAAPIARDLFQSDMLTSASPQDVRKSSDASMLAGSRNLVTRAMDPLLGPKGQEVLANEIARVQAVVKSAPDPEIDLVRVMRSVFYRTVIRVLTGARDDSRGLLSRLAHLCDTVACNPINPVTGQYASDEGQIAERELRTIWRAMLVDSNGVIPRMYRSDIVVDPKFAQPGNIADRELYFETLIHGIVLAVEPAAVAAANTLDYCLRNSLSSPKDEFQGCVRRNPPIPFFVRTNENQLWPVPLGRVGAIKLHFGDRILIHVPTMFDMDPHSPWLDAFGVGSHRCIGSAVAVSFLRTSLDPIFKTLCELMVATTSTPNIVLIDLKAMAQLARPAKKTMPPGSSSKVDLPTPTPGPSNSGGRYGDDPRSRFNGLTAPLPGPCFKGASVQHHLPLRFTRAGDPRSVSSHGTPGFRKGWRQGD